MTIVELRHVAKQYGRYTALEDVSLTSHRGEILGNLTSKGKSEPPDVQGYDTYDYASADVWYGGQEYKVWAIYDEDTGQYAYGYYEEG